MNMTMNGTDMANDTIAEEEPASSDDGRRRLLDMHEAMNDTMMNMTMNDTMGNMTMNGTDMANDTIAEEEPASSDDGRRRLRLLIEAFFSRGVRAQSKTQDRQSARARQK